MKKTLITIVATVLVCACIVGGTFAWLMDKTDPVKNTFTIGSIDITLTESDDLDLKMIPGETITKDPVVTVKTGSEACWVFIELEKTNNPDEYLTYSIDTSVWTSLEEGVWYAQTDDVAASDISFNVLTGKIVTVKDNVTKDMADAIVADTNKQPALTFTAYAIQKSGSATAADAWAKLNP